MKQIVLITGANGLVAKQLTTLLEKKYTIRFLTRKVTKSNEFLWNLDDHYLDIDALQGVAFIIHLAGASIADKRWTTKRKQILIDSRVASANLILEKLKENNITINTFISASAVGYYGTTINESIFTEESSKGDDFLSDVCHLWEDKAKQFKNNETANRIAIVRIGVILAKNGGALNKMTSLIRLGFGSAIGKGNQYMPWIHIHDLCAIFKFLIEKDNVSGVFNAVSPEHITNKKLTLAIGKALHKKILLPNIPSFIIRCLFGEMSVILLKGNRVSSDKIQKEGFTFKFKNLNQTLQDIFN